MAKTPDRLPLGTVAIELGNAALRDKVRVAFLARLRAAASGREPLAPKRVRRAQLQPAADAGDADAMAELVEVEGHLSRSDVARGILQSMQQSELTFLNHFWPQIMAGGLIGPDTPDDVILDECDAAIDALTGIGGG